jgi:hypothetical protein
MSGRVYRSYSPNTVSIAEIRTGVDMGKEIDRRWPDLSFRDCCRRRRAQSSDGDAAAGQYDVEGAVAGVVGN